MTAPSIYNFSGGSGLSSTPGYDIATFNVDYSPHLSGQMLLLYVVAAAGQLGSASRPVIDTPDGWTLLGAVHNTVSTEWGVTVFARRADGSEPANFTAAVSYASAAPHYALDYAWTMHAWKDWPGGGLPIVSAPLVWNNGSHSTPAGTGSSADQLHLCIWTTQFTDLGTVDAATTLISYYNTFHAAGIKIASEILSSTAVPSRTMTGTGSWQSTSIAFDITPNAPDEAWDIIHLGNKGVGALAIALPDLTDVDDAADSAALVGNILGWAGTEWGPLTTFDGGAP